METHNILAHRGVWKSKEEQNTPAAIQTALENGFGIEIDIRDHNGQIVVSHDVPLTNGDEFLTYAALCNLLKATKKCGVCALNIKSDGLYELIQKAPIHIEHICNAAFYFDMSMPETVQYLKRGLRLFSRVSEFETPVFPQSQVGGIWLDKFGDDFKQIDEASRLLELGYTVAFVSPELHGREHTAIWQQIREAKLHAQSNFMICTDYPYDAATAFSDNWQ